MEEKKLWNKLRSGDSQALEKIYRTYFDELYRYGKSYTKDLNTIEDCIQEMFIDIWNTRARLSETDAIKPYLYVTLKRRLFQATKKSKKISTKEIGDMHFGAELAIDQIMINNETTAEQNGSLHRAFKELSDRQKEILYLKYYADMSYDEISEIMDLNYQSARNLVSRAILKLSKYILLVLLMIIIENK